MINLASSKVPIITDASLQPNGLTLPDIEKQLETLVTAKSMGHDTILAIVQKTCAPELAAPLANLFWYNYITSINLTMWKIFQ
eukprot:g25541.t1